MMIRVEMRTREIGRMNVMKLVKIRSVMKKAEITIQEEQEVPEVLLRTARKIWSYQIRTAFSLLVENLENKIKSSPEDFIFYRLFF